MKKSVFLALFLGITLAASAADRVPSHPHYRISTTEGDIVVELNGRRAPLTVLNFIRLVDKGYYNGTIFHRVIEGFMVQAGGYTPDYKSKEPDDMIPNESGNGLSNMRGTLAMARQEQPHTAAAQFYINLVDNQGLDPSPSRWGYTVFGIVIEGMDVVDKIGAVETGPGGRFPSDVPVKQIVINKIERETYD